MARGGAGAAACPAWRLLAGAYETNQFRAAACTDSSRHPADRHACDAGHAGHPAASIHHAADLAASGSVAPAISLIRFNGNVQAVPGTAARYATRRWKESDVTRASRWDGTAVRRRP